jgi:hypothetical protein
MSRGSADQNPPQELATFANENPAKNIRKNPHLLKF